MWNCKCKVWSVKCKVRTAAMYSGTADERYLERCTCRCAFAGNAIRHDIVSPQIRHRHPCSPNIVSSTNSPLLQHLCQLIPRLDSHQFCTSHFSYFSSSYCAPPVAMAAAAPRLTRSHALTPKGRTRRRRGCRPPPSFQAPAGPRGALCPYTQVPTCPMLSTQLEGFMRLQLSFAAIANVFAPRLKLSLKSTPGQHHRHPEEVRGLLLSQTPCSRHLRPS
jgi:hypothetical protein